MNTLICLSYHFQCTLKQKQSFLINAYYQEFYINSADVSILEYKLLQ